MGNVIRLGIARIGLAVNSLWTTASKKAGRKPPVVLLVLGAQEVGKSVIASRISKHGKFLESENAYVPTKGFSMLELKDRGTAVRLYDIGGSEAVRELWPHYYPDAHGIIFVVDTSGRSNSIGKQAEILTQVLRDERVKRKPLLVLGNKQDVETVQSEQLITQMDLIQTVNTAKCLTRVDMTSKQKVEAFEDGLMIGFRWMITYVKWHWAELSERVEHDSMLERSRENAKFEALHLKSITDSPAKETVLTAAVLTEPFDRRRSAVGSPSPRLSATSVRADRSASIPQNEDPAILMVIPQKRLDPEGGNDIKEWKPDATHQAVFQPDTEDELPEVVIVESRAEVHFQRPRSESAVTLTSSTTTAASVDGIFGAAPPLEETLAQSPKVNGSVPNGTPTGIKPKTSHGLPPTRPKLFRNKTAPVWDQPIRIPITNSEQMETANGTPSSLFLI